MGLSGVGKRALPQISFAPSGENLRHLPQSAELTTVFPVDEWLGDTAEARRALFFAAAESAAGNMSYDEYGLNRGLAALILWFVPAMDIIFARRRAEASSRLGAGARLVRPSPPSADLNSNLWLKQSGFEILLHRSSACSYSPSIMPHYCGGTTAP